MTEVKQLRSKLEEVTKRNEAFRKKVQKLMEQNNKVIEENTKLKAKEEVDSKTMIALKKECAEINGQMGNRIDQIRSLMARNEKLVDSTGNEKQTNGRTAPSSYDTSYEW